MVRIISRYKLQALRFLRLKLKFVDLKLCQEVKKYFTFAKRSYMVKTMSRSSTILPFFKNVIIYVYTGKKFIPFLPTSDQMGHKFGEFIYTRRFPGHKKQGKRLMFKKKVIQPGQVYKHNIDSKSNCLLWKKVYKNI